MMEQALACDKPLLPNRRFEFGHMGANAKKEPLLKKRGSRVGAGDRGRTGTVSPPPDFESGTSANSITPACVTWIL